VTIGTVFRELRRGVERTSFHHRGDWLASRHAFALDPELHLDPLHRELEKTI
jgi:hypothetical protein